MVRDSSTGRWSSGGNSRVTRRDSHQTSSGQIGRLRSQNSADKLCGTLVHASQKSAHPCASEVRACLAGLETRPGSKQHIVKLTESIGGPDGR
jgi:hypothetical protein